METAENPTILDRIDNIAHYVTLATAWLAGFAVIALMLHIIADVFLRYFFNAPLPATIEIVSYWWMILIVFPAMALTQRRKEHVEVTLLTELMAPLHAQVSKIIGRILTIVTVAALCWFGWVAALEQMHRGEIAMGSITILIWPMRFMVPLGMAVFLLQLLIDLARDVQDLRRTTTRRSAA